MDVIDSPNGASTYHLSKLEVVISPKGSGTQLFKSAVQNTSTTLVKVDVSAFDPKNHEYDMKNIMC